eukprot:2275893-Prorocentrum_lima.AAC.1
MMDVSAKAIQKATKKQTIGRIQHHKQQYAAGKLPGTGIPLLKMRQRARRLSLIHISEPTRLDVI